MAEETETQIGTVKRAHTWRANRWVKTADQVCSVCGKRREEVLSPVCYTEERPAPIEEAEA